MTLNSQFRKVLLDCAFHIVRVSKSDGLRNLRSSETSDLEAIKLQMVWSGSAASDLKKTPHK